MLVQFKVKNVLSFKDEAVLDLSAVNEYSEHPDNLIDCGNDKFLRVAAIYGANASGKSNLILALQYFQSIVRESFNNVREDSIGAIEKYYEPFTFEDKPYDNSEFEIVIRTASYEYTYGFEYNDKCVVTEWLYGWSLETHRITKFIERETAHMILGASVRTECNKYSTKIPPETLALSFFNRLKLNTPVFTDVYNSIMATFVMDADFCNTTDRMMNLLANFLPSIINYDKATLMKFVNAIDIGITDISCEVKNTDIVFTTIHKGANGQNYPLNLYNESDGTIKSIVVFIFAHMAILRNYPLFVDELNIKLHPLLLKFIVDLFYTQDSHAQLIYTTHDTTLMDKKFFRRDQIFFVQKNDYGCSELSALSDFKIRSDASFEKDYLSGVYGGIPFLKEFGLKEEV